jgi:hypothetical protein
MEPGYSLIDSEAQHRAHPKTWDHPDTERLDRIGPSWLVKIGVCHPSRMGERFWCRVKQVTRDGFVVRVQQPDMWCGDLDGIEDEDMLTVERRHILDLQPPAEAA